MTPETGTPDDRPPIEDVLSRFLEGEPEPGDGEALAAAMERNEQLAAEVRRLLAVDDLLRQTHELDPSAFTEALKTRLAAEDDCDDFTRAILDQIPEAGEPPPAAPASTQPSVNPLATPRSAWRFGARLWAFAAAAVLLAVGALWWLAPASTDRGVASQVAWLNNAQNCQWAEGGTPAGGIIPGKVLQLEQGLAELLFHSGVSIVLQGPATLELRSESSVRLLHGRLSARVPEAARGFEVLSPEGKVVDLGTEFGVSVADDGSARVYVFRGEVIAQPAGKSPAGPVSVREQQSAQIGAAGVSLETRGVGAENFVRAIVPPPSIVPRSLTLDFRHAKGGTLQDRAGLGTGLTHRLPGTGQALPLRDTNLRLDTQLGRLELTTTENDLNRQCKVDQGEYVGVLLSDLGFTGTEDFEVTAVFPNTPALGEVDQLGLYAGTRGDKNIRGGLLRPGGKQGIGPSTQFFVRNNGGDDSNLYMVGMVSTGADLVLTLKRVGGKYSLMVENQTTGESTSLSIRHPEFLDGEKGIHVGLFGATPWRNVPRTISVKEFKTTVWTRRYPGS